MPSGWLGLVPTALVVGGGVGMDAISEDRRSVRRRKLETLRLNVIRRQRIVCVEADALVSDLLGAARAAVLMVVAIRHEGTEGDE